MRCREARVLELSYYGSCVTAEQPEAALPQRRVAAECVAADALPQSKSLVLHYRRVALPQMRYRKQKPEAALPQNAWGDALPQRELRYRRKSCYRAEA